MTVNTNLDPLKNKATQTPAQATTTNLSELAQTARNTPQYYDRTPQYSTTQNISNVAQQQYQQMRPQIQNQIRQSNQQYQNLSNQLQQQAANMGMMRSGHNFANLGNLAGHQVNSVNQILTNAMQSAYDRALPIAQFQLSEQGYLDQLTNQQAQQLYNNLADYYARQQQQDQWRQQFDADQAQRGYSNLADYYSRQMQQDQFNAGLGLQDRANQLALLQALMNYNLGVGEITDNMPMPNQFTYGDAMVQLLKQMGYL